MDGKVKVRFLRPMYPYNEGDEGFVYPMIVEQYPEFVEVIKTKEATKQVSKPVAEKMVEKPIADKAVKKKATK